MTVSTVWKKVGWSRKAGLNKYKNPGDPLRKGLINYLACIDEKPDSKTGKCLGLACLQKQYCNVYKVKELAKCQALGRIRAALRCINLPCISAKQDGRINLIKDEGAGSVNPSDPFPE